MQKRSRTDKYHNANMGDNEKLMCRDCEYFTLIDTEQAEAYPWCDAHNKRVLPTDYCQYFKQNTEE